VKRSTSREGSVNFTVGSRLGIVDSQTRHLNSAFLFLTVVIIQRFRADHPSIGVDCRPLIAVGVMAGVADWIIGDDVENQILGAGIPDLMRFAGLKDERVARFDRCGPINVPDSPLAGNDMVELPLAAM